MVMSFGSLNMVIKRSMGPYSCKLCRICCAMPNISYTTHRPGIANATSSLVPAALFVTIETKYHDS